MSKSNLRQWLSEKKLIVVHWLDAASKDEWHPQKDTGDAQECISCGILLNETEASLNITHTISVLDGKDVETCCAMSIPKGCIIAAYEIPGADAKIVSVKPRRPRKCKK